MGDISHKPSARRSTFYNGLGCIESYSCCKEPGRPTLFFPMQREGLHNSHRYVQSCGVGTPTTLSHLFLRWPPRPLVLDWRSGRRWQRYKFRLLATIGGQPGRRDSNRGAAGLTEGPMADAFALLRRTVPASPVWMQANAALRETPADWNTLARAGAAWKRFIRWACFDRSL